MRACVFLIRFDSEHFTESLKVGVREWISIPSASIPSASIQQNIEPDISVSFKRKFSINGREFSQTWNKQREGRHAFAKKSALLSAFFPARIRSSSMMMRLDCSFGIFQSNSKCFNEGKGLKFGFSLWFPYDDICIFFFSSRNRK